MKKETLFNYIYWVLTLFMSSAFSDIVNLLFTLSGYGSHEVPVG